MTEVLLLQLENTHAPLRHLNKYAVKYITCTRVHSPVTGYTGCTLAMSGFVLILYCKTLVFNIILINAHHLKHPLSAVKVKLALTPEDGTRGNKLAVHSE